jgi:hypothetical protein
MGATGHNVNRSGPTATLDSEILTAQDVAMRLKLRPETIYELTRRRCRRPLPAHRVGKVLRFVWSEVLEWFLANSNSVTLGAKPVSPPKPNRISDVHKR